MVLDLGRKLEAVVSYGRPRLPLNLTLIADSDYCKYVRFCQLVQCPGVACRFIFTRAVMGPPPRIIGHGIVTFSRAPKWEYSGRCFHSFCMFPADPATNLSLRLFLQMGLRQSEAWFLPQIGARKRSLALPGSRRHNPHFATLCQVGRGRGDWNLSFAQMPHWKPPPASPCRPRISWLSSWCGESETPESSFTAIRHPNCVNGR